jgi:hypothetical protein
MRFRYVIRLPACISRLSVPCTETSKTNGRTALDQDEKSELVRVTERNVKNPSNIHFLVYHAVIERPHYNIVFGFFLFFH